MKVARQFSEEIEVGGELGESPRCKPQKRKKWALPALAHVLHGNGLIIG